MSPTRRFRDRDAEPLARPAGDLRIFSFRIDANDRAICGQQVAAALGLVFD